MPSGRVWDRRQLRTPARSLPNRRGRHVHRHAGGGGRPAWPRGRAGDVAGGSRASVRSAGSAGYRGRAAAQRRDPFRGHLAPPWRRRPADGSGHRTSVAHWPALPPRALRPYHAVSSGSVARVGGLGRVPWRAPPAHGARGDLRWHDDRSRRGRAAGPRLAPTGGPGCLHPDGGCRRACRRAQARAAGDTCARALLRAGPGGASG